MQNFHIFLTSFMMFNILIQNKSKWHSDMIEFKSLFRNSMKTFNIKWRKITWWQILKFKFFSRFRQSCAEKHACRSAAIYQYYTFRVYTTIKLIRKLVRVTSVCKRRWFTSRCHNISLLKTDYYPTLPKHATVIKHLGISKSRKYIEIADI